MTLRSQATVIFLQSVLLFGTVSLVSALPQTIPLPNAVDKAITQGSSEGNAIAETYQTPGVGDHIPGSCGFHGNPDVYGLGIRIGIYAQWLSTLMSNWLVSKKVSNMRGLNTCFQLAMLFAIFAMTNQSPMPHAIDIYIIMAQIIGSLCTLTAHTIKKTDGPNEPKSTSWGSVIRYLIYWSISAYSTYFWFRGYRRMRDLEEGCEPVAWLFVKVSFYGWYRILLRVISSFALVCFTVLAGFLIYQRGAQMINDSFIGEWRQKREEKRNAANMENGEPKPVDVMVSTMETFTDPDKPTPIHRWTPAICIVLYFCAIAAVECMIIWNDIEDVQDMFSTGQLIPLVTGVGGLLRVLYIMWREPKSWMHIFQQAPAAQQVVVPNQENRAYGENLIR